MTSFTIPALFEELFKERTGMTLSELFEKEKVGLHVRLPIDLYLEANKLPDYDFKSHIESGISIRLIEPHDFYRDSFDEPNQTVVGVYGLTSFIRFVATLPDLLTALTVPESKVAKDIWDR